MLTPAERERPIRLAGTTLDGDQLDTKDWLGQVVVVNFWGSWCVTCRNEAGALEKTAWAMRPQGVQFLGVATRDTPDNARSFLRSFPKSYPSLIDDPDTNAYLLTFRGKLPVASTPTTFVLDRQGRVAARAIGLVDGARLRAMIEPVLAEGAG